MKKTIALALALVCVLCLVGCSNPMPDQNAISNSGPFGNGDDTVFAPHREDFSSETENSVSEQFGNMTEVKKAYIMRTNAWFLSDSLTDFSQAVTTEIVYVAPGGEPGTADDMAYSFYVVNENGEIEWGCSAYPPEDSSVPSGFSGLTHEIIQDALSGIAYEDYIITYAQRLDTVFIWARCEKEDVIVSYPTRPDFIGLENGGIYTLGELQRALSEAYKREKHS